MTREVVELESFLISLLKSGYFPESYIYSERGNFGASSYDKNSIFDFFRKVEFFKRKRGWLNIEKLHMHDSK